MVRPMAIIMKPCPNAYYFDIAYRKSNYSYAVALVISQTLHIAWYLDSQETKIWQAIAGAIF
jgi:hypothetical protein